MAVTTTLTEFMVHDGTTLQAVDPDLSSVELVRNREVISFETFAAVEKAAGRVNASITISGRWVDTTGQIGEVLDTLLDDSTPQAWEYYPEGNTSGKRKYSGNGLVSTASINSSTPGVVEISATIEVDGAVTSATVA